MMKNESSHGGVVDFNSILSGPYVSLVMTEQNQVLLEKLTIKRIKSSHFGAVTAWDSVGAGPCCSKTEVSQ